MPPVKNTQKNSDPLANALKANPSTGPITTAPASTPTIPNIPVPTPPPGMRMAPAEKALKEKEAEYNKMFGDKYDEVTKENNPTPMAHREALESEMEKLRAKIADQGRTIDTLQRSRTELPRRDYEPDESVMRHIWDMAYKTALSSIFSKGLAYWNGKGDVLKQELARAAIRADEALEQYISVRKVSLDPVRKELQDWQRNKSTNELVKPQAATTP